MKVLHVPFGYLPDPPGGTEVYVAALTRELALGGIDSLIAAPTASPDDTRYDIDGVPVYRFAVSGGERPLASLYGQGDPRFAGSVMKLVRLEAPDVIHLHAYTTAISGGLARALHDEGRPVVATYHTPSVTCQRGTLLRFGHSVCDGRMIAARCAACVVQGHGIPRPIADIVGYLPSACGRAIQASGLGGGVWTALQMSELMRLRHEDTRLFLASADVVVAPADWVQALLIANGVDPRKIVVSRHGVGRRAYSRPRSPIPALPGQPLRALMLGRIDPIKGFDVPLAALASARDLQIELDIYGNIQGETDYVASFRQRVARDDRVRLLPALAPDEVVETIARYDVMLVPSQVLETGPLVVLESHVAGVPVIGTALGGIADRVRDDVNGKLVPHRSASAWAAALQQVASDRSILERWRREIPPVRTMSDVADEMLAVYSGLAHRGRARPALS